MLETSEGFLCISEHHMGVKSKEVRWSDGLVGGGGSDGDPPRPTTDLHHVQVITYQ